MSSQILSTAQKAALKSAAYIREKFKDISNIQIVQKSQNDLVTIVDKESEILIIEEIRKSFPSHTILGEEYGQQGESGEYTWIIDPLDGTKNFIQKIPVFAVSIGVMQNDKIVAGVVADVMGQDLYYAETAAGAFRNEKHIFVSDQSAIHNAFFATGFPFRDKEVIPSFCRALEGLLSNSSGARRIGAAALDLCWLAQGSFDYFFEFGLSPWDVAAASIIITEAGGTISDFNGESNYLFGKRIIASNGKFHKDLLALIPTFFEKYGDQAG